MDKKYVEMFLAEKAKLDADYVEALFEIVRKYDMASDKMDEEKLKMPLHYDTSNDFVNSLVNLFEAYGFYSNPNKNRAVSLMLDMGVKSYKDFLKIRREDVIKNKGYGMKTYDLIENIQSKLLDRIYGKEV